MDKIAATIIGIALLLSSAILSLGLNAIIKEWKMSERNVVVKGLSEKEVDADVMILPIKFTRANDDLNLLYKDLESDAEKISNFLESVGLDKNDITPAPPSVNDKLSDLYRDNKLSTYRYVGVGQLLLYTKDIAHGREALEKIAKLGKDGIVVKIEEYEIEYLYTKLNSIKPQMIEEATINAREAAQKFAEDSKSKLGKIKRATQGQFSISNRDKNTPHIKTIRVVSTVEYYLQD